MEDTITFEEVIKNTKSAMRSGNFPNHDAFDWSALVGAAINAPKEVIMDALLESGD